jgi:hypothetical protein
MGKATTRGKPSPNGRNGRADGTPTPAPAPKAEGRGADGRFTKGWKGGPGNPFARRVAALRSVLLDVVDEAQLRKIACRLAVMAELGDVAAAKLVFLYTLGKPAPAVDPDRLDLPGGPRPTPVLPDLEALRAAVLASERRQFDEWLRREYLAIEEAEADDDEDEDED